MHLVQHSHEQEHPMGSPNLPHSEIRHTLLAAFVLALLLPANAGTAGDSDLFSTRVAPNVVFLMDTSGSMNNVVWHPAYRPDVVYDTVNCPYIADLEDPDYDPKCLKFPLCAIAYDEPGFDGGADDRWSTNDNTFRTLYGRTGITKCSNTRDVFTDPLVEAESNETRWQLGYLRWYFSENVELDHDSDGNTILEEILATGNGNRSQCVLDQDPSKSGTFDKYRRSRMTAAKEILRDVICQTNQTANVRYGLAKFFAAGDPEGGYLRVAVDDYTSAHANDLEAKVDELEGESWTPLSESLYNVYRSFQSRTAGKQALGKDGSTRFPTYDLDTTGATAGTVPGSPLQYDCQKNFVVVITDGEPTMDDFDDMNFTTFRDNLIGDYNNPGDEDETPPNVAFAPIINGSSCGGDGSATTTSCEIGRYLDDIAKFMQDHDFQLDDAFPSKQVIDTYTVGFTTTNVANELLNRSAAAGNGEFFFSNNAEELTVALTDAINAIIEKSMSFTAATVPASRTTDGDNFYTSFFLPKTDSPFWEGHLKNYEFTMLGDILTANGFCATGDVENLAPSPTCPTSGRLRTHAPAFWDAALEIPDPGSRNLFVEFGSTSMFAQPLEWNTSNVSYTDLGIIDGVDELDEPYAGAGLTAEVDIAAAVIDVISGCEFDSSPCVPRTDHAGAKTYLGDIFHSNPVVVGSPNASVNEAAYHTFAMSHRTRTRVIYAGANDGFLHAVNAGDWQTKEKDANGNLTNVDLIPPRHDRGTGEELFGFMPYWVRNKIKDLPKQLGSARNFETVDGSPIVADAWLHRNVSGGDLTTVNPLLTEADKLAAQWRSILIGGLRDGGRSYYALDVSDPTAAASDVSTAYPRYLWGFPCENATAFCSGTANLPGALTYADYMGNTWSEPVITRVRVHADGGLDPRGYERWVAIFGAGYDPKSDPNKKPSADAYDVTDLRGRAIFMVDITTGGVLAMKHFDADDEFINGAQIGFKEMKYAFASAPAVFDLDFDGFADVIYIGDVGGNLWKWVVHSVGDDPINNSLSDDNIAQPSWPFRLFFQGSPSASPPERLDPPGAYDDTIHYQSFFFPPTGVLRNQNLILAFGAGERAEPIGLPARYNDGSTSDNNHYYVVKDADPLERGGATPDPISDALGESDLADFDDPTPLSCDQMKSTRSGYYITARDAEKFITNSVVFLGTVFTASFLPPDPADLSDPCASRGSAFLYAFDLECGIGKFTTEPGGVADKRRKAIGSGIPTRPRVSVGDLNQGGNTSGCKNKVVVITSDGNISNDCPGTIPGSGISVRSWRER
jgi:type IV pilus assembly protein PilY1